jgi:hypothetical protein
MHDFFRKMVTYVDEMARKTHAMLADGSAMKGHDRRRVSAQLDAVPPFSPMLFLESIGQRRALDGRGRFERLQRTTFSSK